MANERPRVVFFIEADDPIIAADRTSAEAHFEFRISRAGRDGCDSLRVAECAVGLLAAVEDLDSAVGQGGVIRGSVRCAGALEPIRIFGNLEPAALVAFQINRRHRGKLWSRGAADEKQGDQHCSDSDSGFHGGGEFTRNTTGLHGNSACQQMELSLLCMRLEHQIVSRLFAAIDSRF